MNLNFNTLNPYFYPEREQDEDFANKEIAENKLTPTPLTKTSTTTPQELLLKFQKELTTEQLNQLVSDCVDMQTEGFKKNYKRKNQLTVSEAQKVVSKIVKGKIVHYLSALHPFFIEVMKVMKEFFRDRSFLTCKVIICINSHNKNEEKKEIEGKELLQELTVDLGLLLKICSDCFDLRQDKINELDRTFLLQAQKKYTKVISLYWQLEEIIASSFPHLKNQSKQLKQYLDVLFHLSHDNNFLKKCSESLSKELQLAESIMIHCAKSSRIQFFADSLEISMFTMSIFAKEKVELFEKIIKEIEAIPQSTSKILKLDSLKLAIQNYRKNTNENFKGLHEGSQKLIIQTNINPSLKKLKLCFEQFDAFNNLLALLQEIIPLIKDLNEPWNTWHRDEQNMQAQTISRQSLFNNNLFESVLSVEKELKKNNKKISKEIKIKIKKILDLVEASPMQYLERVNAFLFLGFKMTDKINQEMNYFFSLMDKFNEKAINFQQSLLASPSELPSSSFSAIDLLVHHVSAAQKECENKGDIILSLSLETAIQYLRYAVKDRNALFANSPILNLSDETKVALYDQCLNELVKTYDILKSVFEIDRAAFSKIKTIMSNFIEYKKYLPPCNISFSHFLSTLFDPINQRIEVSLQDIPLIKDQQELLTDWIQEKNQTFSFGIVKKEIKNLIEESSKENIFFWKLNLKYLLLLERAHEEIRKIITICQKNVTKSEHLDDILMALHEQYSKIFKINGHKESLNQITILVNYAERVELNTIFEELKKFCDWHSWFCFLQTPLNDIVLSNDCPKKTIIIDKNEQVFLDLSISDSVSEEDEKKEEDFSVLQNAHLSQEMILSSFLQHVYFFNSIQSSVPPYLHEEEPVQSLFLRTFKRNELIENCSFRYTLIEESKKWSLLTLPSSFSLRGQVDGMLILEATQKVALSCLRIATKETPHIHLLSTDFDSRPLFFTHNGKMLTSILQSAGKQWFAHEDIQEAIDKQENLLKRVFWFQEDSQEIVNISLIASSCEKVWRELADKKISSKKKALSGQVHQYQKGRIELHRFKREQIVEHSIDIHNQEQLQKNISLSVSELQISSECPIQVEGCKQSIVRTLDFIQMLFDYEDKTKIPLFFVTRSAECQVNLLSQALILALSSIEIEGEHALLKMNKGRPLFHTHRLDTLWRILKEQKEEINSELIQLLDAYLPLFLGDPRYPYPNKTALTMQLVSMQEKIYLLMKLESGWLGSEENELLVKYLGKRWKRLKTEDQRRILEEAIEKDVEKQQKKNLVALHLADKILNM